MSQPDLSWIAHVPKTDAYILGYSLGVMLAEVGFEDDPEQEQRAKALYKAFTGKDFDEGTEDDDEDEADDEQH